MENTAFPNTPSYHIQFCAPRHTGASSPKTLRDAVDLYFYEIEDLPIEQDYNPERLARSLAMCDVDLVNVYQPVGGHQVFRASETGLPLVLEPLLDDVDTLVPNGTFVSEELGNAAPYRDALAKMKVEIGIVTAKNVVVPVRTGSDYGVVRFHKNGAVLERYDDALLAAKRFSPKVA